MLDYTGPEFAAYDATFDVVFDAVAKLPRSVAKRLCGARGRLLSVARDVGPVARMTTAELTFLTGLVEAGSLCTFIDRQYPLRDIRQAHAYVGQWHKRGHVVIAVDPGLFS